MRHSSSAPLFLAIDAGTSACRAQVFDPAGRILSAGSSHYRGERDHPQRAELDPENLYLAVEEAVGGALAPIDGRHLAGVGVSAQLGLVPVAPDGKPRGAILTWADQRAGQQAQRIRERLGDARIYPVAGRRISPEWPAAQILYGETGAWGRLPTHKYLSLKDHLVERLTGSMVTDPSHASYTLLFNVGSGAWDSSLLHALGIDPQLLPDVRPAWEIAGETTAGPGRLSARLGLPSGLPVVVGGPDGSIGAVGAGLVAPRRTVDVAGTTDVVFAGVDKPLFDPLRGFVVNRHAVPGLWTLGGPLSITGGCLDWFSRNFGPGEDPSTAPDLAYDSLEEKAARIAPGAEGLICFTGLSGERAPFWEPARRGLFFGISQAHGRAHFTRAILEGGAMAVRMMFERLTQQGAEIGDVTMVGGTARSRLACRIRADVLGRTLRIPAVPDATGLGTAILLSVALGIHGDFREAAEEMITIERCVEPEPDTGQRYQAIYGLYRNVHESLAAIVHSPMEEQGP